MCTFHKKKNLKKMLAKELQLNDVKTNFKRCK